MPAKLPSTDQIFTETCRLVPLKHDARAWEPRLNRALALNMNRTTKKARLLVVRVFLVLLASLRNCTQLSSLKGVRGYDCRDILKHVSNSKEFLCCEHLS